MRQAKRLVTRDLPTPPFPETIAITFFTEAPSRKDTCKSRDLQFELQVEQLCVQFSEFSAICNPKNVIIRFVYIIKL